MIKGKVLSYSLPSFGPGADAGVQAVSPQVTLSHWPSGNYRLLLLFARPVVTFPAEESHRPLAIGQYQIILLCDRGTWVWTTCQRLLLGSAAAGVRSHDHWVTSL